jgi:hypothetical protein
MTEAIPRFPLTWPDGWRRTGDRKRAAFKTYRRELSVMDGTKRVLYELERLGIRDGDAVISTNVQLRLDGLPRSDRGEPGDPGAAVYWRDAQDRMKVMAVDRYDRVADNLAAVAATLEAMRAIERHGGGEILERSFTGFDALPPPPDPFAVLGVTRSANEASINAAWRAKVRAAADPLHGSQNLLVDINVARDKCLKIIRGEA